MSEMSGTAVGAETPAKSQLPSTQPPAAHTQLPTAHTPPPAALTPLPARGPWFDYLADLAAAAVVLLGGGLFGGGLLRGLPMFAPGGRGPGSEPSAELLGAAYPGASMATPLIVHLAMVGLLLVSAGLMFARRQWPMLVFGITLALFVLSALLAWPLVGAGIAVTIAAYSLAFRAARKPVLIAVSIAAVLLLLLAFAVTEWSSFDSLVFQFAASIIIAAALGDSARSRREYLLAAEDRALRAEQTRDAEAQRRVSEERLRIARDLHDTIAHQISVISLHAGAASATLESHPDQAQQALGTIREAARGALGEIGELLRYLRDEDRGPVTGVQGLAGLPALLESRRQAGLAIDTDIRGDLSLVTGVTDAVAYRVAQEGLTNAHKHGSSGTAQLSVHVTDARITIEIGNPVTSAAGAPAPLLSEQGSGLGLIGIRERVAVLHGTVESSLRGGRYVLEVQLPLQHQR